jgi:antitoxin (DNA-binding transcriptional repressor) of toxin-antitoxin stability system
LAEARHGEVTVVTDRGEALLLAVPLEPGARIQTTLIEPAAQLCDKELISLGRTACCRAAWRRRRHCLACSRASRQRLRAHSKSERHC